MFKWKNTYVDDPRAGLRKLAVDDPSESSFGGTIRQIQRFDRIGITDTGGVIDQLKRLVNFYVVLKIKEK